MFSWLSFQMNMDNYPHVTIAEDGILYSMSQYRPGIPRMMYDALLHLGHNGGVPVYRGRTSMAHGQDRCEVSITLPLSPTEPWGMTIIGIELDKTVEQAAHAALTALCGSHLNDTAAMPIALFLIHEQEEPMWRHHLQDVIDLEGPHFHVGMVAMTVYVHYMFNLQRNTIKTIVQQRLWMTFLEQHVKGLKHKNATLHSSTLPPSGQDHELQVAYYHLSKAEHGWHYARQQIDTARMIVDERTHTIIHLEHHVE
jgi:hypothetical protein